MQAPVLLSAAINGLQLLCSSFGKEAAREKLTFLKQLGCCNINNVSVAIKYHDVLLFLKAYPDNKAIAIAANAGLEQIQAFTKKIMEGKSRSAQEALSGTGMANSLLVGQYSYLVTKWLTKKFPAAVAFHSAAGDDTTGAEILQQLLPRIEYYYTTQGNFPLQNRLQYISGNKNSLQNILQLFGLSTVEEKLAQTLFEQLKIYTEWTLEDPIFNRSFIEGIRQPLFYHDTLVKKIDASRILHGSKAVALKLTPHEKNHLLDVAKASLAFYYRETEPITRASATTVQLFNCGRGLSIALYGMKPEYRLSIESYVGYMVFKNNVPVAYGGGWMFGDRCKIGLNIYPPFRKGESAFIFASVLGLYHQLYHQQRFIVKPYQYGKGNKEGLATAAFWFYYKMGFRPADKRIAAIAAGEFSNNSKSSLSMLKLYTTSNLELHLTSMNSVDIDPENLSRKITGMIVTQFDGDRQKAIRHCCSATEKNLNTKLSVKNNAAYKEHFQQFSLILYLLPNCINWTQKEKKLMLQIIAAKNRDEKKYIEKLQEHKSLIQELNTLLR